MLPALAILVVCSFAPGFYFVRRFAWSALEKLCGSIALSLILVWLAAWGIYVAGMTWGAAWGITAAAATMGALSWRDAAALFRVSRVRRALAGYGFLLVWTVLVLALVRNFSGGTWKGDWLEHFQRSLYFLHRFPVSTPIVGGYELPARPPAMNVIGAFVMAQAGDSFEVLQGAFAFLNLLLILPCVLALPMLARPRRPPILPLVALFAASPVLMQNASYAWTKALTAFFVVFAICLYLRAWRHEDTARMTAAFVALGMAFLVHYSAGPYLVFFALHYLLFVFPQRRAKWRELAVVSAGGAVLLATWFCWSIAALGVHSTFASNTSVTSSKEYQGSNLEKITANLFDSVIPHLVRDPAMASGFPQPNAWGQLRDHLFVIYQSNLVFCVGALAGPLMLWLLFGTLRRRFGGTGERGFWIALVGWSVVVGIAVAGEREPLGLAHLTLVPMTALGLTLVASRFTAARALALAVIVGCVIDFTFGVFLQARMEHLENGPDRTVFAGLGFGGGQFRTAGPAPDALGGVAWENWMRKHQYRLAAEWNRGVDAFQPADRSIDVARAAAHSRLDALLAEDDRFWHGWYRRHGGEIRFFGDRFGGSEAPSALLVLVFGALMWKLTRAIPATPVARKLPVRRRAARR